MGTKKFNPKLKVYRRWQKTWPERLNSPWIRVAAFFDLFVLDHGLFRPFFNRPTEIASGIYRSAQPSPGDIKRLSQKGFKTIISLRGTGTTGPYLLSKEACEKHRIDLKVIRLYSKRAPSVQLIRALHELIQNSNKPLLLHCKSGADRSGMASALYLLLTDTGTIEDAKAQLSWRYLHIKQARTGVLDWFLESYEDFYKQNPVPFMEWVENYYDREAVQQSFKPKGWANILVDGILRRE